MIDRMLYYFGVGINDDGRLLFEINVRSHEKI
jgi:hypothetical protein